MCRVGTGRPQVWGDSLCLPVRYQEVLNLDDSRRTRRLVGSEEGFGCCVSEGREDEIQVRCIERRGYRRGLTDGPGEELSVRYGGLDWLIRKLLLLVLGLLRVGVPERREGRFKSNW